MGGKGVLRSHESVRIDGERDGKASVKARRFSGSRFQVLWACDTFSNVGNLGSRIVRQDSLPKDDQNSISHPTDLLTLALRPLKGGSLPPSLESEWSKDSLSTNRIKCK